MSANARLRIDIESAGRMLSMKHKIIGVDPGSPAACAGVCAGMYLTCINDLPVVDIIDYERLTAEESIELTLCADGAQCGKQQKEFKISLTKEEYEPLGLNFETSLMSPVRQCANHCIFCFIDQMPRGNRKTLYFKDDDWRLSLIMGNYVTLTNVSDREFERMIARRVSPLYVSVHATDGAVRKRMMRSPNSENILSRLMRLHEEGLAFNCQIVLCPGYNDGDVLKQTLNDLFALRPECRSVAVVPVGLTAHRQGLAEIQPTTAESASAAIKLIDEFKKNHGLSDFVYASDEMYLAAGQELPTFEECGDFEQIENGVGLFRRFEHDFMNALEDLPTAPRMREFDSVSGVSIAPHMSRLFKKLLPYNIKINVHPVVNDFFGNTVTVTGLVTAGDIIKQCKDCLNGEALLIPHTMLRENDVVFLDGMCTDELAAALQKPIWRVSADDGYDFIDDIINLIERNA